MRPWSCVVALLIAPLRIAAAQAHPFTHADTLRGLRAIYIDAGKSDQYYLDLGAEGFRKALARIGVTDVFFELIEATHSAIEYRYPIALRYLAERLA